MTTTREFVAFLDSLPDPTVQVHNLSKATYLTIDLKSMAEDILEFQDFMEWWTSKKMTPRTNGTVARHILKLDPPEGIKNSMLLLLM
jgi:hypothetical protein